MNRVEPCACGGFIAAPSLELSGPAVLAHNRTVLHRFSTAHPQDAVTCPWWRGDKRLASVTDDLDAQGVESERRGQP